MQIEQLTTPVVIVGAGPAGVSASLFLSQAQIPHVILEKQLFPRDKICGDAISGKVIDTFTAYDEDFFNKLELDHSKAIVANGIRFFSPNRDFIDIPFPDRQDQRTSGYISKRVHFDEYLFNQIDSQFAKVFQNASVKQITENREAVKVNFTVGSKEFSLSAQVIIGADGPQSIVAKSFLGRIVDDKSFSASVRAYYKGVKGLAETNFLELHFIKGFMPGYFWIFPLADGRANVGLGMLSSRVKTQNLNLRAILEEIVTSEAFTDRFSSATKEGKTEGWGLPLGMQKRKLNGSRWLLCGDAAWLVDPFTGEGIGNAVLSGKVAAKHIVNALSSSDWTDDSLSNYTKEIYELLLAELRLSKRLQQLSSIPWLFNFVVKKTNSNKTLQDTFTCMFNDLDIRSRLSKPSFYFNLLFNKD